MTATDTTPSTRRSSGSTLGETRSRNVAFGLVVVAIYLGLGIVAFWPVLPGTSQRLFGSGSDSILAMWFLAWIPHALTAGLNPFFSHAIFEPAGVNLAQNTEGPMLGLLTAPLAVFLGPVARANVLMVLAMPVSAFAAFFVLRKWQVWAPAAAIGGLIYGFSAYSIGQGLGHVVLMFIPIPPLIALTVTSILRRDGSPVRLGLQLGLLAAAQFLCEPEIFTTVTIITAWGVACAAIRFRSKVAESARFIVKALAVAAAVAVLLLAYPIWMMLEGPQHYTGTAQATSNPYFNDLLSFVTPGPMQRISLGIHFSKVPLSNPSEAGAYLGLPMLILAVVFVWRSRHSARMQLAVATLFGALVLSLGSHLTVNGATTHIPLPFSLLARAPLLNNVLPSRLSLEVAACLAAIVAFGLDDVRRNRVGRHSASGAPLTALAVCGLALAILVVTQLPRWPYASQSVHPLPNEVSAAIPSGNPLAITYPYASPVYAQPMLWQAEDGFAFRLVGGYAEHPDTSNRPTGLPNPIHPGGLDLFLEGQEGYNPYLRARPVDSQLVETTKATLRQNNIRVVIVDRSIPGASSVVGLFTRALGPAAVRTPSFALWVNRVS